jgi:signal transduction histidine kinase/ABC-type nitrate/sulfonate/bicarbonate transport system substrate-binding protein
MLIKKKKFLKGFQIKKLFILILPLLILSSLFAKELQKTSIQLMWVDQFEFAGFYIAKEKGFYEKAELDVEIKKYDISTNVLNEVLENKADFGVNSTSLIIEKSNGKDIVLLGSIFQSSPIVLLALKDSHIKNLQDIINKKVMITREQYEHASLQSMLISENIPLKSINSIEHTFKVDDLINKKTDLMIAYTTNEPYILNEKGYEIKSFSPKDYGFDFYEELIFTSKEFANNNPELVKNFYNATIKGWYYAFENIEETAQLIYEKYNPQNKSLASLIYEANEMKKLVYDKNKQIGTITKEKINLIINTYKVLGLMKNTLDIDDLIYTKHLNNSFTLNKEEKAYLKNKKEIKMCVDPNWMPFEKIENNKHIGISADYIDIIKNLLNIPITLVQTKSWSESLTKAKERDCDILPLIVETADRDKYLNFTSSYIKLPLVMAGGIEDAFIEDINQYKNKKIGISKDYAFGEVLKARYPQLTFVEVENMKDGFEGIQKKEISGFVENLTTVGFAIQKNYIGQIKIIAKLNDVLEAGISSRKDEPLLNSILQKALDTIDSRKREEIYNKWVSVNYQKETDYDSLNKLLFVIIGFILIFILFYRQYLLKKMNEELNKKIKIEMKKNEERNRILIQQSRMASMGEMLENIAHQWRQPLSTISVSASGIQIKKELNILNDEDLEDSLRHIKNATQYLSNTIEDFRNFFSKDKIASNINTRNTINKTIDLISSTLAKEEITLIRNIQNIDFTSYENELIQVLMNILINAKDALENKNSEKLIIVIIKQVGNNLVIKIKDNAGGIKKDIIDKIFEPYFTTKHQTQGTGIGLYMSKLIVEKHLNGEISVQNIDFQFNSKTYTGALFQIILPLDITNSEEGKS